MSSFVLFVSLWFNPLSSAQLKGSPELAQALAKLPVTASVLHAGAHPDDENSLLLAYLARGRHVRTAYLSATRGDGGQNLLGTEQGEALGLLRTQELLDARRLDGAEQFFTRAFDFGFSKTAEETFAKWGHEEILGDYVRIVRQYRPDVVVSVFSGTPRDGHGHHQASGIMTPEAVKAAADPNRFPEQLAQGLRTWQVKKFYQTVNRFGPTANDPLPPGTLQLAMGDYDPVLGESYAQIGANGRTLHRSQGFAGFAGTIGPGSVGLTLVPAGVAPEQDIFDGIDITLNRYTALGAPAAKVAALRDLVNKALAEYRPEQPEKIVPLLAKAIEAVRGMRASADAELAFHLDNKENELKRAIALAYGSAIEAICERPEMIPGQSARVTVTVWNRSRAAMNAAAIALSAPAGWKVEAGDYKPGEIGYNQNVRRIFTVAPASDAAVKSRVSQPYWLALPRQGDRFTVEDPAMIGRAESPALMNANVTYTTSDTVISQSWPVVNRQTDPIYGQRDVRVNLVPEIAAWTDPPALIFAPNTEQEVRVRLRNNSAGAAHGVFTLEVPAHWAVEPRSQEFEIAKHGDESSYTFKVRPQAAAQPGMAKVAAPYDMGYQVVNYPHIVPQYWFHPAQTKLRPVDLKMSANRKVGYIMGPGDEVPAALRQLGVHLTMLEAEELLGGDLAKYDVIVAGIRSYTVRQDLMAANHRLLDYVKNGGVYIVQYQGSFQSGGQPLPFGPYPMAFGRPLARVTVEEAPVEILAPDHPLFNVPNKISAADFEGWVQERGLNFMGTWDPQYTPLLASSDPGEDPQKGGMLAAPYGKGLYLYTGYAWFRQLPAGVPGAYRIWANLLSWKP